MQIVGLTGSIAMGKSHAARMFQRFGVPVFDSDDAVHRLFATGQQLPQQIAATFGDVLNPKGEVDRAKLGAIVLTDPSKLRQLEELVHPAVHAAQSAFIRLAARQGFQRILLDIPLLLEGGRRERFDVVLVVACSKLLQRQRALSRPGMTPSKLQAILAKQMPVAQKLKAADRAINSGYDRGQTHRAVAASLAWLEHQPARAWPRHWQ